MARARANASANGLANAHFHVADLAGEAAAQEVEELLAAFGRHLALQRGLSEHTVRGYLSDVRALLGTLNEDGASSPAGDGTSGERGSGDAGVEPAAASVDLTALDLTALRAWLAGQSRQGLARSTVARRSAAARTFSAWAHRQGYLAEDVGLRLLSPRPDRRVPKVLGVEEAASLLDLAAQRADDGLAYAVLGTGDAALDACFLIRHLRAFFGISVLKGAPPEAEPAAAAQLAVLDALCAQGGSVDLLDPRPMLATLGPSGSAALVADPQRPRTLRDWLRAAQASNEA